MGALAALAILAVSWLVWWWQLRGRLDVPRSVLGAAIRWLPADRADWGRAMLAELDRLDRPETRWLFALGCARAAVSVGVTADRLWPLRALVAAGGAAGLGAGIVVAAPELRVFATVLAVELGACGWLAWSRLSAGSPPGRAGGWPLRAAVLAGAAACVGLTVYGVARYPAAGHDPTHAYAVLFGTVLTGYVWLALRPPAVARAGGRYHLAGAVALTLVWGAALGAAVAFGGDMLSAYALGAALVVFAGVGALAGRSGREAGSGLAAGLWTGLAGALSLFVVGMVGTYVTAGSTPSAGSVAVVGDNLDLLMLMLLLLPALGVPFGQLGGALAARLASPGSRTG